MADATSNRPQKVTLACLIAGMGSAIVLISVFVELRNWGSLEVREQVETALAGTPFVGDGVDVDQVLDWLRLLLMVVAAGAAAGLLLAIWTARRHRGARVGLSVLAGAAGLAFLATGLLGLLPAALAAACVYYLWSKEARAWFAGEEPPRPTQTGPTRPADAPPSSVQTPGAEPPGQYTPPGAEAPSPGAGAPSPGAGAPPPGAGAPSPGAGAPPPARPRPSDHPFATPAPARAEIQGVRRPRSVVVAVVVTSVMAGLVGFVCGANALLYLVSPSDYAELLVEQPMLREQQILDQLGMSAAELARWIFVGATVCAVLAVAAIGTALLMLRRLPWARIGFTMVTGLAIVLSVMAFPFGLVWVAGEIFVLVQIYRVDANAWFARR